MIDRNKTLIAITILNVVVASGFSIAGLISPSSILPPNTLSNEASSIFALYAAARTIPLALFVLFAAIQRSTQTLLVLGILSGIIQAADVLVGVFQHDVGKTIGPLVLSCLQFYAILSFRPRSTGS